MKLWRSALRSYRVHRRQGTTRARSEPAQPPPRRRGDRPQAAAIRRRGPRRRSTVTSTRPPPRGSLPVEAAIADDAARPAARAGTRAASKHGSEVAPMTHALAKRAEAGAIEVADAA